ncbi:SLAM family member 5 isoform X6 [Chelonia mydas]|uniref:SLAM family member 5 isoform X6 n=1 Tax=Chelonia mydas TaxID=8469 RepID=UPI001CA8CD81|nr:SLAM family member 5 isoform X6 [Chelonia mydas]
MGTPWCVWLTLLLFYKAGSSRAEAGTTELSAILGGSITFPLGIPAEQVKTVAWTRNTTRSVVTVAAGNPPHVIVSDASYEGRLSVPAESYSLQISSLRMEDTGTYKAQIRTATDIDRHFLLRVFKQVPEPAIVCDSVTCVNETCNYNLSCTVRDGGENVTYSWTRPAGGAVVSIGPILTIFQGPRDAHLAVTCTAQNPVSHSSTTASAKDLCVEADAETNTVYAKVGNSPQVCSRTGTQKRGPETKEDETKTIYSKVHHPNQSPPQTDDEKLCKEGLESMGKGEKTIYTTVNQPNPARGTKTAKSTDADDSAATPKPQATTEYDKII